MLSGSETAITTLPREKIHQLDDSKKNKRIKNAKDDIEKTIGGILVANNFVNILMASLATIIFVRQFGAVSYTHLRAHETPEHLV